MFCIVQTYILTHSILFIQKELFKRIRLLNMKLANQTRMFNRPNVIEPPVPLERMATPKFRKDQVQTFKCRNNPTDNTSAM